MDLLSLNTFKAVVEYGGVQQASKQIHTVQSNVTARIKRLEEELQTSLFYRKGRKLELTPAGTVLLEYANKLLQLEKQAGIAVRQVGQAVGEIRIGSMESFAAVRMPGLLQNLMKAHPNLVPKVQSSTTGQLVEDVLNHKLDCAFVGGPISHPDLICHQVLLEELVIVSAKNTDVPNVLIMFREGCAYRERAESWLKENGKINADVMSMGTQEGILGCVAVGLGFTLVPKKVVEESKYAEDLDMKFLDAQYSQIPTLLITHKEAVAMTAVDTMISIFSSNIPEWESAA